MSLHYGTSSLDRISIISRTIGEDIDFLHEYLTSVLTSDTNEDVFLTSSKYKRVFVLYSQKLKERVSLLEESITWLQSGGDGGVSNIMVNSLSTSITDICTSIESERKVEREMSSFLQISRGTDYVSKIKSSEAKRRRLCLSNQLRQLRMKLEYFLRGKTLAYFFNLEFEIGRKMLIFLPMINTAVSIVVDFFRKYNECIHLGKMKVIELISKEEIFKSLSLSKEYFLSLIKILKDSNYEQSFSAPEKILEKIREEYSSVLDLPKKDLLFLKKEVESIHFALEELREKIKEDFVPLPVLMLRAVIFENTLLLIRKLPKGKYL